MGALWVAVVLTAVAAVAALGLGLLLARRYRELHAAVTEYTSGSGEAAGLADQLPEPDAVIEPFEAVDRDGRPVSAADFAGADTVVAFFLAGCGPCRTLVPELRRVLAGTDGRGPRPVVVLGGDEDGRAPYIEQLAPYARIVEDEGAVSGAFGVKAFPTVTVVGDGRIRRAGLTTSGLDLPVAA